MEEKYPSGMVLNNGGLCVSLASVFNHKTPNEMVEINNGIYNVVAAPSSDKHIQAGECLAETEDISIKTMWATQINRFK